MNRSEYDKHHIALDERIIGYSAVYTATDTYIPFDSTIPVFSTESALRMWLMRQGITAPVEIITHVYGGIKASLHEEGISFSMDVPALQRFHRARAEDFRFVPAIEEWEADDATMVEAAFNPYRDSVQILKDQIQEVQVGFCPESVLSAGKQEPVPLSSTACRRKQVRTKVDEAIITWREYLEFRRYGARFDPDEISQRLLNELTETERFCDEFLEWEKQ